MIRTSGLTRQFKVGDRTVDAVRGIDLEVEAGELVALLGPERRRQVDDFRMLTTLLRPTSGSAEVVGRDVVADPAGVRQRIGAIGQGNGAGHASVRDELVDQGCCYGLGRAKATERANELLDALELSDLATRVVRTLSGGQRRRLDIAMGLVHRPELLFLDEPSTGLDPQNRANLAELITSLRADHGTTVMLTTHYLDEADTLADRVVIVDHGLVIADDTPERLKAGLVGDRLEVHTTSPGDAARDRRHRRPARRVGARALDEGDVVVARSPEVAEHVPALVRACDDAGATMPAAGCSAPPSTTSSSTLTGRSLRESAVGDETHDDESTESDDLPGGDRIMTSLLADTALVLRRELRPMRRDPFSVIFTMVQPLVFLAFFGPLLDQVPGAGGDDTLQWFVPGIIVMSALFGASTTGANLQDEIMTGSYERMLVTPLRRSALLLGRAAKEIVPVLVQVIVIVLVTIPFGFDLYFPGPLLGIAIVAAFAIGLGSMSHALALATRENQWMFWAVQQTCCSPCCCCPGSSCRSRTPRAG